MVYISRITVKKHPSIVTQEEIAYFKNSIEKNNEFRIPLYKK